MPFYLYQIQEITERRVGACDHQKVLTVSDTMRSHAECVYRPPGMSWTPNGTIHGGRGDNSRKEWLTKKVELVVVDELLGRIRDNDVQMRLTLSLNPKDDTKSSLKCERREV